MTKCPLAKRTQFGIIGAEVIALFTGTQDVGDQTQQMVHSRTSENW